ncbi:MAG TPA: hypothetical protein VNO18_24075 [Xanthobacteraceae bacterium]|jgi:hypothetical protein|nr:hypothetical protein [Xanthobacteraceae bacterium]
MFAHHFRTRAAVGRPIAPYVRGSAILAATVLAAVLAGCSQTPQRFAGPDPSDPRSPARTAVYRSVIEPYASQRPVEPAPWRDQNDRIAPAPKP